MNGKKRKLKELGYTETSYVISIRLKERLLYKIPLLTTVKQIRSPLCRHMTSSLHHIIILNTIKHAAIPTCKGIHHQQERQPSVLVCVSRNEAAKAGGGTVYCSYQSNCYSLAPKSQADRAQRRKNT